MMKKIFIFFLKRIKLLFTELRSNAGLTLIEMMIVLAIIAIIGIIAIPRLMDIPQKTRVQAARQQMLNIGMALRISLVSYHVQQLFKWS